MYSYFILDNTSLLEPGKSFPDFKKLKYKRKTKFWLSAMSLRSKLRTTGASSGAFCAASSSTGVPARTKSPELKMLHENVENKEGVDAGSAAQAVNLLEDSRDTDATPNQRPTNSKRAISIAEQKNSLERGAKGINIISYVAHKRLKLIGDMVVIEKSSNF